MNINDRFKRISLSSKVSSEWRPIRITINYDALEGKDNDPLSCQYIGQKIENPIEGTHICEEQDILTEKQISSIKGTMTNVANFLSNTLQVQSFLDPITIEGVNETVILNNTDFVIMVSSQFSNSLVAFAIPLELEDLYSRPYLALIKFNPRHTPAEVINDSDWNNEFYYTVLHEITHALGFSSDLYEKYHPHENPEPYKNPVCQFTKYGKNFTFLVTPYSHIFAKKRFGVETFTGDDGKSCPSGIELEDGGTSATALSHLEYRTYYTEYMIGQEFGSDGPFPRFTDATMAILLDTGNYKVNWANLKPLVFGHPESIDGKPIPGFAIDPPQYSFHPNYLINYSEQSRNVDFTGFDYKHYGQGIHMIHESQVNCSNDEYKQYCIAKDSFYNPKKQSYISSNMFADYQLITDPFHICEKGKAIIPGIERCSDYTCHGYESFNLKISKNEGEIEITCNKQNAGKELSYKVVYIDENGNAHIFDSYYRCPDPERFCRTMKLSSMYFDKDPLDPNTKVLEGEPQEKPEWNFDYSDLYNETEQGNESEYINPTIKNNNNFKKGYIALIVTGSLAIITIICIVIFFLFAKKPNIPDSMENYLNDINENKE
ncbi:GP63-like [Trichomonas vaginalis G3]|uniref:GP63-like n=1 Tax=Trichomonas vaginalis (strain ATCC PRA-98 / G3) TaxID=412133 RepID=A2E5S6_TRIV3|nr:regulation of choline O-acetyltransferase protein [Trichomonas vaginalis G3]EAY11996.1 GP63-like [Trichomonas vaginalis G3]KAI5524829.1 regulation of choline O-acetyltransferase protein [Trichomonas vaginalis G3]|eukprot:XP_001324219.1 GP63-like [Trichomonas vaginalis G3]